MTNRCAANGLTSRYIALLFATALSLLLCGCATIGREQPVTADNVDRLAELNTRLGVGYLQEGRYDVAWKRLQRALEIEPNYSVAHNAMALLNERLDKPQEAETHYRRAIEVNPGDSAARNNYGRFLCAAGRPAEAQFLQAAENPLYDSPAIAYTNAGLCLYRNGNSDRAETYLRRALEINPKVPAALLKMGTLSLEKGRPLPARAYLQRYLEVGTYTPEALWLGIRIERELGGQDAAAHYALLLQENFPDSHETRLLLESQPSKRPSTE